jgi:hypothetical protein
MDANVCTWPKPVGLVIPVPIMAECSDAKPPIDGDTWWRGQQLVCGTMALATLEALTAGVDLRCESVERADIAASSPPGGRWPTAGLDELHRRGRGPEANHGMWRGSFVKSWV